MKHSILVILSVLFLAAGASFAANGPQWYGGLDDCPDYDGDGICNGDDLDYVPGDECPDAEADYLVANPDAPNADDPLHMYGWFGGLLECKDDDNDGICNGQDEDYNP